MIVRATALGLVPSRNGGDDSNRSKAEMRRLFGSWMGSWS